MRDQHIKTNSLLQTSRHVDMNVVHAWRDRLLKIPHKAVVADFGDEREYLYRADYDDGYPNALRNFLTRVMLEEHFYLGGVEIACCPTAIRLGVIQ